MEVPVRILFISSEVKPFATVSKMAGLIRKVPEYLDEAGGFESRIMMPRYGTISERKNRLHEVIRLSGSKIALADGNTETLKVKVASIPGIRLQVYFMDNSKYFKRKGVYKDRDGKLFEDNLLRALLFGRSVIETAKNLGWSPAVVHAHGWMAGLAPYLLRTEYASNPLFEKCKILYSADGFDAGQTFSEEDLERLGLEPTEKLVDVPLPTIGHTYANVLVTGEGSPDTEGDAVELKGDAAEITEKAVSLYGSPRESTVEA